MLIVDTPMTSAKYLHQTLNDNLNSFSKFDKFLPAISHESVQILVEIF